MFTVCIRVYWLYVSDLTRTTFTLSLCAHACLLYTLRVVNWTDSIIHKWLAGDSLALQRCCVIPSCQLNTAVPQSYFSFPPPHP